VQRPPCSRLRGGCQLAAWHRTDQQRPRRSTSEPQRPQAAHTCVYRSLLCIAGVICSVGCRCR
jgi:hypothetical protein